MSPRELEIEIDYNCRWCGGKLTVVGERHDGLSLVGLRDLVFIHTGSGISTCTQTYRAQPYDGWAATAAYERALSAHWEAQDAAYEEPACVPPTPKEI